MINHMQIGKFNPKVEYLAIEIIWSFWILDYKS
jgi:hypothetical protein